MNEWPNMTKYSIFKIKYYAEKYIKYANKIITFFNSNIES